MYRNIYLYRWGLASMLNNYYFRDFKNDNLNVYIIDQTVNLDHPEFDHIKTKGKLGGLNGDHSHATSIASIIVGKSIGVIRDPNIHLYNYASCQTVCLEDGIWNGLIDVKKHLIQSGRRGVINFSFDAECGDHCGVFDSYFKQIISVGGIIVSSAGNSNNDACKYEPQSSLYTIAVGSYDYSLTRASYSNYGNCIDTWGPGTEIYVANWNGYGYNSGTSMAAPSVKYIYNIRFYIFNIHAYNHMFSDFRINRCSLIN